MASRDNGINVGWFLVGRTEDQSHTQPEPRGDGSGGSAMIGLISAMCYQRVSALIQCMGHDVFQLADFIAGGFQAGEVVALEENALDVQMTRKILHLDQRRGQHGEGNSRRLIGMQLFHHLAWYS